MEAGVSKSSVHRMLKKNKMKAYKTKFVQQFHVGDEERRLQFCEWALHRISQDPLFIDKLIFTDESTFIRHGQTSRHWTYHWSDENPHESIEFHAQNVEKLNVWSGIGNRQIIGPFFIEGNLNGEKYRNLLEERVWPIISQLVNINQIEPIFIQDGAPAHNSNTVRGWLDEHFPGRWIGTRGPVLWPPRSPDFTPMDFFLWGYLKNLVYPSCSLPDLRHKIERNIQNILPETLDNVKNAWVQKLEICVTNNGGHFEHL